MSNARPGTAILLVATISAGAFAADTWKFDFGPPKTRVFPGFTQVTHATLYTKAQGYGWVLGAPLPARAARTHYVRKGAVTSDPDDLSCDMVRTGARFRVDVPAGAYRVAVILGDIGGSTYYPYKTYAVLANGQPAVHVPIDRETFYRDHYFRNRDWEYTARTDVFDELVRPRLKEHIFQVDAPKGCIELRSTGLPWLGAVIYPASQKARMDADMAAVLRTRRKQFHDREFAIQWPRADRRQAGAATGRAAQGIRALHAERDGARVAAHASP